MRASDKALLALCLVCGAVFGLRNSDAKTLYRASSTLDAPADTNGLLQRPSMQGTTGASFLCREKCTTVPAWPTAVSPDGWLKALGQTKARRGVGERPDAPALIRFGDRWLILWGERSDRLEVILEHQGAGVWPRDRFDALYGSPWWGPLK